MYGFTNAGLPLSEQKPVLELELSRHGRHKARSGASVSHVVDAVQLRKRVAARALEVALIRPIELGPCKPIIGGVLVSALLRAEPVELCIVISERLQRMYRRVTSADF